MSNIDSAAVDLASADDVRLLADLAKWIILEQDRTWMMVAAGVPCEGARRLMRQGD